MDLTCPRCSAVVDEPFYGPCVACRADLRSRLGGKGRVVERATFVPTMHMAPNAVALKDD